MTQTIYVINLNSGTAKKKFESIEDKLEKESLFLVEDTKSFTKIYDDIIAKQPESVVIGGGDGTIIRGIEYLSKNGFDGKYGLIPLGTANYLARNLSLPLKAEEALDVIKNKRAKKVPIASVNGDYFALMMTIGLSRLLSEKISDQLKRNLGQFAYIIELIRQSKNSVPFSFEITSPNLRKPIKGKSRQLLIYNSDLNQQIKLVPDHELEKPTVKLVTTDTGKGIWRLYVAIVLHLLSFGKIRQYIKVYELNEITISTEPSEKADIDGEIAGECPFEIKAVARHVWIYH